MALGDLAGTFEGRLARSLEFSIRFTNETVNGCVDTLHCRLRGNY